MLIGYARVSTEDQKLDMQVDALVRAGVDPERVWSDKTSGVRTKRKGLAGALDAARKGDVLVVWKLDRLARSLRELVTLLDRLHKAGIELRSLTEGIDTTTPTGTLVFHLLGAIAEFERALISERTKIGMRSKNRRGGRPKKMTSQQVAMARKLMADPHMTSREVAEQFNVERSTLYRSLRQAKS